MDKIKLLNNFQKYHSGVYTEGSFVLAEGSLVDGVFEVKALGFPPAELESTTRLNI